MDEYIFPIVKSIKFLNGSEQIGMEKSMNMSDEDIEYINQYIAVNLKLESCKKGKSIIRYGDRGDKFYIILQGRVSVQVPP